jgi:hypothetical protein
MSKKPIFNFAKPAALEPVGPKPVAAPVAAPAPAVAPAPAPVKKFNFQPQGAVAAPQGAVAAPQGAVATPQNVVIAPQGATEAPKKKFNFVAPTPQPTTGGGAGAEPEKVNKYAGLQAIMCARQIAASEERERRQKEAEERKLLDERAKEMNESMKLKNPLQAALLKATSAPVPVQTKKTGKGKKQKNAVNLDDLEPDEDEMRFIKQRAEKAQVEQNMNDIIASASELLSETIDATISNLASLRLMDSEGAEKDLAEYKQNIGSIMDIITKLAEDDVNANEDAIITHVITLNTEVNSVQEYMERLENDESLKELTKEDRRAAKLEARAADLARRGINADGFKPSNNK